MRPMGQSCHHYNCNPRGKIQSAWIDSSPNFWSWESAKGKSCYERSQAFKFPDDGSERTIIMDRNHSKSEPRKTSPSNFLLSNTTGTLAKLSAGFWEYSFA